MKPPRSLSMAMLTPAAVLLSLAGLLSLPASLGPVSFGLEAWAQTPPVTPPASTPVAPPAAATPAPATPAPANPETPAVTPAPPPAAAQTPAAPPADAKVQVADPFGEEATLTAKKVIAIKGNATWDNAFEALTDSLKTLTGVLDKQGMKASGPAIIVYTSADDNGLVYQAQLPVEQDPKNLPKDVVIAKSPEGKALKFIHRGSYDTMENTYEAITNYLDDKKLEANDTYIEEYTTDPLKTPEDKLVITIFVPPKIKP